MFCSNHLSLVSDLTIFSFLDRKSPDFGKNEGETSIFIRSYTYILS